MSRKYAIVDTGKTSSFNFDELVHNEETSRYSLDRTKIIATFEGDTPDFLSEETILNHSEALAAVVNNPEWDEPSETPVEED